MSFFALVFLFVCFVRSFAVCYLLFRLLVFVCMLCLFLSSLSVLLRVSKCGSRYMFVYFSPSSGLQIYVCEACASLLILLPYKSLKYHLFLQLLLQLLKYYLIITITKPYYRTNR